MIAFITILYVVAIVLVFKVCRVKPRPWPIALFVTAGILMIGGIVIFWTLAAPISERAWSRATSCRSCLGSKARY